MVVIVVTYSKKYTIKERILMAITWLGKATVQAALSGIFLTSVNAFPDNPLYAVYKAYGIIIQTTAIISILICAPIGAILLNTFGTHLLTQDIDETPDDQKKTSKVDSEHVSSQNNSIAILEKDQVIHLMNLDQI